MRKFKRMNKQNLIKYVFISSILLFVSACVGNKNVTYFKNLQDSSQIKDIKAANFIEPLIRPDDILSVNIQTIDPGTNATLNQGNLQPSTGTGTNLAGATNTSGYLVDKEGSIELPLLGKIKVSENTTTQARELVRDKAKIYYKNPTVQVRFSNFKITVLGEVSRPAPYILPNEKVSILDAIGLAGDLTIFGKRENVLLIRENNGKKEFYRFNLNSTDSFKSPAFYLQQNDIIYVEANKAKQATLNASRTQLFSIIGSVMSLLIVAITRIK